ncbi:MAG: hypothetical protein Q9168_002913 [Polycauliona sp. 1 TL-2023]
MESPFGVPYPGLFPPPPGVKANYDKPVHQTLGAVPLVAVFLTLSTACLILRFYTKCRIVKAVGWDDITIGVAYCFNLVFMALYLKSLELGSGTHVWDIKIYAFNDYLKVNYIYTLHLPSKAIVANAIFIIVLVCVITFSCHPVKKAFDLFVPGKCINLNPLFMASAIANPILDIITLTIPIPMIVQLHVNRKTKFVLAAIFLVSSCTIIISGMRLWAVQMFANQPAGPTVPDSTWETINALNLAVVELNLCIICGSVLVLRPFCRQHLPSLIGRTRPSEPVGASPGLQFDGPSGPSTRNQYRAKVSTIGGSGSNRTRKYGLWDGFGDTLFTNNDEEDFQSLNDTELGHVDDRGIATPGGTHPQGYERHNGWSNTTTVNEDRTTADTMGSTLGNLHSTRPEDKGIMKTVSLDVR